MHKNLLDVSAAIKIIIFYSSIHFSSDKNFNVNSVSYTWYFQLGGDVEKVLKKQLFVEIQEEYFNVYMYVTLS